MVIILISFLKLGKIRLICDICGLNSNSAIWIKRLDIAALTVSLEPTFQLTQIAFHSISAVPNGVLRALLSLLQAKA